MLAVTRKYTALETPDSFHSPQEGAGPSALVASVTCGPLHQQNPAAIPTFPGLLPHSNAAAVPGLKLTSAGAGNLLGNTTAPPGVLEDEGLI